MAHSDSSPSGHPTTEETPHGCCDGWIYLGHMVIGDDGDEVEVYTAYRCCRCDGTGRLA